MQLNDIVTRENYYEATQFCNANNYCLKEIEPDEKGRRFQIQEQPKQTQQELYQLEYNELKYWFDKTYAYKEQKYRRLIALNKADDDGISAETKLNELYAEAETKRLRIQELEKII